MRLRLLALVIAAAACGGSNKPTTPPPALPDDSVAKTEATPPPAEEKPAEEAPAPEKPAGPIDVAIPAAKPEVKLLSAGKGKKQKLVLTPKAGTKQTAEWTVDFGLAQDGPPEMGGKVEQVEPTTILTTETETKEVDATTGQAKYVMTVSAVDGKDATNAKTTGAERKTQLATLVGATFGGTVEANGISGDATLHIDKPEQAIVPALQVLLVAAQPMWPALPSEPVGPGAKWTVTTKEKVAGQVDVTKTVTYELVGKKGKAWTLKGTTKITGEKQNPMAGATIDAISGEGTHEFTITDGALLPASKQTLSATFTITVQPPAKPPATTPPAPVVVKVSLNSTTGVAPKS